MGHVGHALRISCTLGLQRAIYYGRSCSTSRVIIDRKTAPYIHLESLPPHIYVGHKIAPFLSARNASAEGSVFGEPKKIGQTKAEVVDKVFLTQLIISCACSYLRTVVMHQYTRVYSES